MANNWIIDDVVELSQPAKVMDKTREAIMVPLDNEAHVWRLHVYQNGSPLNLSGTTVVAYFVRHNATDKVQINGTVSSNVATVTLTEHCYDYPGEVVGVVRLVKDGIVTTIAKAIFWVGDQLPQTTIDGGDIIPTIENLDELIATLEADTAAAEAIINSLDPLVGLKFEEKHKRVNLFDPNSRLNLHSRRLNSSGGLITDGDNIDNYAVSAYIPIVEGRTYHCYNNIANVTGRLCIYKDDLTFISSVEYPTAAVFVAPEHAAAVRITYPVASEAEVRLEEYAPAGTNLFNAYSWFNDDGYYIRYTSSTWNRIGTDSWGTSHYIPVDHTKSYAYYPGGSSTAVRVIEYDASLNQLAENGTSAIGTSGYRLISSLNANTAYIRIPYAISARYGGVMLVEGSSAASAFTPYVPASLNENVKDPVLAYLPDHVYCAIGRELNIYNAQACLDPEWYTVRWICDTGYSLGRKFTVVGTPYVDEDHPGNGGDHPLTLQILDKGGAILYQKTATLHVVSGTFASTKKMLMIGDSLTRANKPVLPEIVRLSGEKIVPLGTVTETGTDSTNVQRTLSCESRSGWSPLEYISNTTGNPFYNNGFSWSYYKSQNASIRPDFITIFLGTNGLGENGALQASRIASMVTNIRSNDASIPIFVVNTIYKSNQDGIGKESGSDGYAGGTIGPVKRLEDKKVMDLMIELDKAVSGINYVYPVNAAISMDCEFSFGAVEQPVSERNQEYTEYVPSESIHPQASGYYQIADVLYSAYCARL